MSVKYNAVPRKDRRDPAAAPNYYPPVIKSGNTTLRQLPRRISEISVVSTVDTMAVLEGLLMVLPQELGASQVIKLGDFGSFWLRFKTQGSATPEEVSASDILQVNPRFTLGKEFKNALVAMDFEKNS